MIGLVSQCLLGKAQIAGDGALDEPFISQLIDKFVLLREVKVSDGLKHGLDDSSEGDLIAARSLIFLVDGFTCACSNSLDALTQDVTLSETHV